MATQYATVKELTDTMATEALVALGAPRTGPLQTLLRPLVWLPARRFAGLAAEFDRRVALDGLTAATRWGLAQFVEESRAFGTEHVPVSGPLVVASNHPGSYDGLVIASSLGRDDLKVFASDVPFLRSLYASSSHLIYTALDAHSRMGAVREGIRHLKSGGALLVYASAQVDPDPALLLGAQEELGKWSPSLALFVRQVPETTLLVSIVSDVLASASFKHPLTRLRKEQRLKQFLAEFIQISQQLLFGRRYGLIPTVRFAAPLTAGELGGGRDAQAALQTIVGRARCLLAEV